MRVAVDCFKIAKDLFKSGHLKETVTGTRQPPGFDNKKLYRQVLLLLVEGGNKVIIKTDYCEVANFSAQLIYMQSLGLALMTAKNAVRLEKTPIVVLPKFYSIRSEEESG